MSISEPNRALFLTFVSALLAGHEVAAGVVNEVISEATAHNEDVPIEDLYAAAIKKFNALPDSKKWTTIWSPTQDATRYTAVSATYRPRFILVDMLKFEYAQAAKICGVEEGTIKSGISRARAELKAAVAAAA